MKSKLSERVAPTNLGNVLRKWRLMSERDLRSVAEELGISASSLMRIEYGYFPDTHTMMKILNWFWRTPGSWEPKP